MHTLLIHQAFVPPSESGGTRHYELARYSLAAGDRFTIVASDINYLTGKSTSQKIQEYDGVRVLRAYTYPVLHRGFVWRVFSFISFMCTSVWIGLKVKDIDLVMGTSPPIFQGVSALLVAKIRRKPLLLEIRDLWPEFAVDMGVLKNPILIASAQWLARLLYRSSDHILVNSPAYKDYLIAQGVATQKISFIPNGVEMSQFHPENTGNGFRQELNLLDKFVVTYAGALGMANDISTLLDAAERLLQNPKIHFLLVGDGKERLALQQLVLDKCLNNVTFAGSRPKEQMAEVIAASDICIATLKNIPMFKMTYPNKVFDYMAGGRPIVLAIDGVIRDVVETSKGGIFVQPGNSEEISAAINYLYDNPSLAASMGQSARVYVAENFNRAQQGLIFSNLLKILGQKSVKH
jgi:glycosyltransferase involved in cell wall biosynthesis